MIVNVTTMLIQLLGLPVIWYQGSASTVRITQEDSSASTVMKAIMEMFWVAYHVNVSSPMICNQANVTA